MLKICIQNNKTIVGCLKGLSGKLEILISASAVLPAAINQVHSIPCSSKIRQYVCVKKLLPLPFFTVYTHESMRACNKYCKRKISSICHILEL